MQYGTLREAVVEERLQSFARVMQLNPAYTTGNPGSGYAAGTSTYLTQPEAWEDLDFDDPMLPVIDQEFSWQAESSIF